MLITGINHNCPSINSGKHNIKEISSGSTNHNDLFFAGVIFAGVALNLEKDGPTLSSLNLYQSLP